MTRCIEATRDRERELSHEFAADASAGDDENKPRRFLQSGMRCYPPARIVRFFDSTAGGQAGFVSAWVYPLCNFDRAVGCALPGTSLPAALTRERRSAVTGAVTSCDKVWSRFA